MPTCSPLARQERRSWLPGASPWLQRRCCRGSAPSPATRRFQPAAAVVAPARRQGRCPTAREGVRTREPSPRAFAFPPPARNPGLGRSVVRLPPTCSMLLPGFGPYRMTAKVGEARGSMIGGLAGAAARRSRPHHRQHVAFGCQPEVLRHSVLATGRVPHALGQLPHLIDRHRRRHSVNGRGVSATAVSWIRVVAAIISRTICSAISQKSMAMPYGRAADFPQRPGEGPNSLFDQLIHRLVPEVRVCEECIAKSARHSWRIAALPGPRRPPPRPLPPATSGAKGCPAVRFYI